MTSGQQQSITNIFQEHVAVAELPIHSSHSGCAGCVGQHGRRGRAVGNLKRSSTEGGLERGVEAVFPPMVTTAAKNVDDHLQDTANT